MRFGLNLFSVRDRIKTESDLIETVRALKEGGYDYVQYSGGEYDPVRLRRVANEEGVPVVLTHVPYELIINEPERLMAEHASFGCKNIGLGMMPLSIIKNEAECKSAIQKLNASAKIMKENGFDFFYHHHHFEFYKYGEETILDYMIKNAPYINFTLDTYWLQYGGVDICDMAKRLAGRIECVHLKDYKITFSDDGKFVPDFAPVGDGTIDFYKTIDAMKNAGAKYFLVEQDNAVQSDSMREVLKSVTYLNARFASK